MAASKYKGPADRLDAYEAIVATRPEVTRKGAANPYTSLNGHMFSFLDATGSMSLRLSKLDRDEFLATYDSELSIQYGRVMKEYVVVPDHLLDDIEAIAAWFVRSHEWVATLKPKPTTKKAPTKKAPAKKTSAKKAATKKVASKRTTKKKPVT